VSRTLEPDLLERVRTRLASSPGPPSAATVAALLRDEAGGPLPLDVLRAAEAELVGAGVLEPLLAAPDVTDVLVNGPAEVWVDRGRGLEPAGVRFADDAAVRRLVAKLLATTGRRLDPAAPWVDARLPDGTRLHAVLPPVARGHTLVSLRTLRRQHLTIDDLVAAGSTTPVMAGWLRALVAARIALVVTGGTGSGKTTLLAALLGEVGPDERVVVVEDSAELRPQCAHVVCLEARPPNVDGAGAVTLPDLVRQAMRMRPDRIVVGEVRGPEVVDMLAAMNTGHEGGLTTVHANRPADLPARLEALAAGRLPREGLFAAVAAGLGVVVHVRRQRDGRREVAEIAVVLPGGPGGLEVRTAVGSGAEDVALARLRELAGPAGMPPC
jgi:pilus assembly protein CpaF